VGVPLLALTCNCYALDPSRAVSQYARDVWGLRSGLPKGQISGITQSADGYLWVGTEQGPRLFDGLTFTTPRDLGPAPFAPDRVLGLASHSGGILRYQGGSFTAMSPRPDLDALVTAMAEGQDGSLLFASRLEGVFRWSGSQFETILRKDDLPPSPIISIAASADGDVWLGSVDIGLLRVHGKAILQIASGSPNLKINCLLAGGKHELYAGTSRGLARWDGTRLTQAGLPKALLETPILSMAKDRDENIWIGTGKGLLRLNSQGVSSFGEADSGKAVSALFEDREGDLWAGSVDELERIQESPFIPYRSERKGGSYRGGPIHADSRRRIWATLPNGGLFSLRNGASKEFEVPGIKGDEVYSIAGDGDDLWLGRRRSGLTHVMFRDGVWSSRNYTKAAGLSQNSIYAVHQNRDGTIWAGTLIGGVSHFSNGQFTNYTNVNGLVSNTIQSIAEDSDGTMWFATPSGLSSFGRERWTTYGVGDGLPSENVNTLFEDGSKTLWLGTLRGIAYIRSGKIFVPQGMPPSLLDQICGIGEDGLGSLWITTSHGVLRVDRVKLLTGNLSSGEVREFGVSDGINDPSGIRRERSISTDSNGRVWLSTSSGIGSIGPARLQRIGVPTIVHIDRVVVDGEPHNLPGSVLVPPDSKRIVIEYAGLNLAAPDRVRFRFKLDGFDAEWNPPVTRKEAIYTNLGPGRYRFHVIASNADQVWNEAETGFSFQVEPTLQQTAWFRCAMIAALFLSLLAFYRLRLRQITEQVNNRFEARLAERVRIARELHDTLLQSFHGLMLRFQAVENLLPDKPTQAKQSLATAIERAARAITEGRDAVQELRSNELVQNDLFETLTTLGQELASSENGKAGPAFRVLIEGEPRQLHPSLQEDLYRVSREAMVNAFRHAQANNIELDIRYGKRVLRLRIRDDGIGMDPRILASGGRDGHWGLPGMQERAKAIGGRLEIWSEVSRGTEIELVVPASIAYAEFKRRRWSL
jgi:signal transduction histidine kinase/ligand-binding sensor domain-containing protein